MNVWYAVPSRKSQKDPTNSILKWQNRRCKTAVLLDPGTHPYGDISIVEPYQGYAQSVNKLVQRILQEDPEAQWIVTGGDDIYPDEKKTPEEIGKECSDHFGSTFGVMQPTGDRWMIDEFGRSSEERVCSSPWMGREFCQRINQGLGPIWFEYWHFYEDEELHEVATMLGILWHRPDIKQYHDHWLRRGEKAPAYLKEARFEWSAAEKLFRARKARRFPGHQPL